MRRSRLSRKRKKRQLVTYRFLTLLPLSAFSLSMMTTPSYALMSNQVRTSNEVFSAAFIFPNTIQELAERAVQDALVATSQSKQTQTLLLSCQDDKVNSKKTEALFQQIQQAASLVRNAANDAATLGSQLAAYAKRAEADVIAAQTNLAQLQKSGSANPTQLAEGLERVQSTERVNAYVQSGYELARSSGVSANASVMCAESVALLAVRCVKDKQDHDDEKSKVGSTVTNDVYDQGPVTNSVYNLPLTVSQDVYADGGLKSQITSSTL
jgi:hypothetical protein